MTSVGEFGTEWKGLRELHTALKRAGTPDDAVKDAMQGAGGIMQREAFRLMPIDTGAMARTLKVNRSKSVLRVQVGSASVRYAYTFHAIAMGRSKGGFTFRVPPGKDGRGFYKRQARIPNNPFMFKAAERTQRDVLNAYVDAIGALLVDVAP